MANNRLSPEQLNELITKQSKQANIFRKLSIKKNAVKKVLEQQDDSQGSISSISNGTTSPLGST